MSRKVRTISGATIIRGKSNAADMEIEKIKEKYPYMDKSFYSYVHSTIRNLYSNCETGEIVKIIDYMKMIYVSTRGTEEGFEEFMSKNHSLICSKFNDLKFRVSLFNHYNLLDTVIEHNHLMLTKVYNDVFTTRELYAYMTTRNFTSIEEIKNNLMNMSEAEKQELKLNCPLTLEEQISLNKELFETLQKRAKKSKFIYQMTKKNG